MARMKHGLYGPIVGKLGATVAYIRLGQPVVRMVGHKINKPASVKQKGCRSNMSIVMEFVKAVNLFTNQGFKVKARSFIGKTAQNMAVSYNMLNAIQGVSPDNHLDYSKILVSDGKILNPANIMAELDGGKIKYTWDPASDNIWFSGRQQAMLLAYFPETKEAQMVLSSARRDDGIDFLDIHVEIDHTGQPKITYAETYICFVADDRESVSTSVYTGRIELAV
jgi:hypothetical protein